MWETHSCQGRTVDVLGLVAVQLANSQFAVGGFGSTVASGKVVNDHTQDVLARNVGQSRLQAANVLNGVAVMFVSVN